MADGTNTFTLVARDAAGNSTVTNLSLVKSGVELTINVLTTNLYQLTAAVSGTVSDSGYAVWVNGVVAGATNGAWVATNVPVTAGGTASFLATAYPANEAPSPQTQGGYGTNPVTPNAVGKAMDADKPPWVYVQEFHYYDFTNFCFQRR